MQPHIVTAENARLISGWLKSRGGIAVWKSVNLSNPGGSWTTPLNKENGSQTTKPSWESSSEPARTITDPSEVVVAVDREVKRFHVAVRVGSQGFSMKCTDGASRRIRSAVVKAGEGAYHVFDYDTQEAVIMAPGKMIPLPEWEKQQG